MAQIVDEARHQTPPATPPGRRLRLRFSLLNFMLLVTIICLGVGLWSQSRERAKLWDEVQKWRKEAGYFEIQDTQRVHAVRLPSIEDLTWRWRLYVPAGKQYKLHHMQGEIPRETGGSTTGHGWEVLESGEYVVTCAIRKSARGTWQLVFHTPSGRDASGIDDEYLGWLQSPGHTSQATGVQDGVKLKRNEEPLVLLHLRALPNATVDVSGSQSLGSSNFPGGATDGLMIWID